MMRLTFGCTGMRGLASRTEPQVRNFYTVSLSRRRLPDFSESQCDTEIADWDLCQQNCLDGWPLVGDQVLNRYVYRYPHGPIARGLNGPWGFPDSSTGKESSCSAGDLGSIPRLGRSPGEGNSYPLQYSGLEKSTDR